MTACVLASLGLPITSEAYTFCVVPSQKAVTGETYRAHRLPCLENKTWNEYLADQRRYFSDISNVTFLFYPGTHLMNGSLEANQTENLLIIGSSPDSVLLTSTFPGRSTPLRFNNFSNVRVEGMTIKLCAAVWPYSDYDNGVVYFNTGKNASVLNSRLNTVEPPNKGQVGAWALVHYLGVVLYWGFFVKKPFLCVVRYNNDYYYKCTNQSWNSSIYSYN